jgi:hypothetical protein
VLEAIADPRQLLPREQHCIDMLKLTSRGIHGDNPVARRVDSCRAGPGGVAPEIAIQATAESKGKPSAWDEWADDVGQRLAGTVWKEAWR